MARREALDLVIGVRIPAPQPEKQIKINLINL